MNGTFSEEFKEQNERILNREDAIKNFLGGFSIHSEDWEEDESTQLSFDVDYDPKTKEYRVCGLIGGCWSKNLSEALVGAVLDTMEQDLFWEERHGGGK